MSADKVTLDRDVVERLLDVRREMSNAGTDLVRGEVLDEVLEPVRDALRDALRGAEDEHADGYCNGCVECDLRCAEDEEPALADWHVPLNRGPESDAMPEPASGSVVVTIDGRDVTLYKAWVDPLGDTYEWADVLRYAAENGTTPRVVS